MKKTQTQKDEKRKKIILLIILLLLMIILIITTIMLIQKSKADGNIISDKDVSGSQSDIDLDLNHSQNEDVFTELMGFGTLEITEDYPNIYLVNPEDNDVYLSFDVIYNDEVLYTSGLIEPGKMEAYDIFSRLDAGRHELMYSITSYELDSKTVLWSGIQQNQEILIRK